MFKKLLSLVLIVALLIPILPATNVLANIQHNYDLSGIDSFPTDEAINNFINEYPYVLPHKWNLANNGSNAGIPEGGIGFSLVGSYNPITVNYNRTTDEMMFNSEGGIYILFDNNALNYYENGRPTALISTREVFSTDVGDPNTSGIHFNYRYGQMQHDYNLTGIDVHPTDQEINNFINTWDYVIPLKGHDKATGNTFLNLYGSNSPLNFTKNNDGYSIDANGQEWQPLWGSSTGIVRSNTFSRTYDEIFSFTTDIGTPNTQNIIVSGEWLQHDYNLTGIDLHPTDEQINQFINQHEYVFPIKTTAINSDVVVLQVIGSNELITANYNNLDDTFYISTNNGFRLLQHGEIQEFHDMEYREMSNRNLFTTEIGEPNTANIYYTYNIEDYKNILEVNNLTAPETTEATVKLNWNNPNDDNFKEVNIYRNNVLIETTTEEEYIVTGLQPYTNYIFKVTTIDQQGRESDGVTIAAMTTEIPIFQLTNIQAESDYNRVDLSWNNPNSEYFSHVTIYRKEKSSGFNFFSSVAGTPVHANETNDEYDPLFETNGTYFNDLTVEPETTYEYNLTTTNDNGEESEGQTVTATTSEEPTPTMGGIEQETDENGDFVYSWTTPTSGQVKVMIDGEEYALVDASQGSITIPSEDMTFNYLGEPEIYLQPIGEFGTEGAPVNANSMTIATGWGIFSPSDVLITSVGILSLIGSFVLLVLAVRFTPRLIELIRKSVNQKRTQSR